MPIFYKIFSSLGSMASTVLLAVLGYLYNTVHDEWQLLKEDVAEVKKSIDQMPTPEDYDHLQEKVELINIRLTRIEAKLER